MEQQERIKETPDKTVSEAESAAMVGAASPQLPYSRELAFQPLELLEKVALSCGKLFPEGIHDVYLYGSYARGDFTDESDVDFLVTVDAEQLGNYRWPLAEIVSDLSLEYDKTISVTVKPLERFRKYATVLPFANVLREGIRYHRTF